eukprot:TRINITY_DN1884_c1_g2_i1.p1 TRINITY_DN1884_c1_g2~~TRINITY_DN1884_c1_g2_i1.p1  ORF type:complete len:232 (+),score=52.30 TRINITY_DN1884_c1_g2_i1:433-1128(+)
MIPNFYLKDTTTDTISSPNSVQCIFKGESMEPGPNTLLIKLDEQGRVKDMTLDGEGVVTGYREVDQDGKPIVFVEGKHASTISLRSSYKDRVGSLNSKFEDKDVLLRMLFDDAKLKGYYSFSFEEAHSNALRRYAEASDMISHSLENDDAYDSVPVNEIYNQVLQMALERSSASKYEKAQNNTTRHRRMLSDIPSEDDRKSPSLYPDMLQILSKPMAYRPAPHKKIILEDP